MYINIVNVKSQTNVYKNIDINVCLVYIDIVRRKEVAIMAETLKEYIGVGVFYLVIVLIILGMTYQNNRIDSHSHQLTSNLVYTY